MSERHSRILRPDGAALFVRDWFALRPQGKAPVFILHSCFNYGGAFSKLALWLAERGHTARAFDMRGHGLSDGPRGVFHTAHELLDDFDAVYRDFVTETQRLPVLLSYATSCAFAIWFAITNPHAVSGLVLVSPGLNPVYSASQQLLLDLMAADAPGDTAFPWPRDERVTTHDTERLRAMSDDPMRHTMCSGWHARTYHRCVVESLSRPTDLRVPTLAQVPGADTIFDMGTSLAFAKAAVNAPVALKTYPGAYTDLLNEVDAYRVPAFADLEAWLAEFAAGGARQPSYLARKWRRFSLEG